jgi:hypothetical protein
MHQTQLLSNMDDAARNKVSREIAILQDKLTEVFVELERTAPEYAALRRGEPAAWAELQNMLAFPSG